MDDTPKLILLKSNVPPESGNYWTRWLWGGDKTEWKIGYLSYGEWQETGKIIAVLFFPGVREGQDPNCYEFGDEVKRPEKYD